MAIPGQEERVPKEVSQQQRFIDIEAPTNLQPGQNFFDQPPFITIIQNLSSQTGISEVDLKRLAHSAARIGLASGHRQSIDPELTSSDISKMLQDPYSGFYRDLAQRLAPRGQSETYRTALKLIGSALENYPYWNEYILTQCTEENYAWNGAPSKANSDFTPLLPETYAKFASDRSYREKRQVLLGLDEVFPQDFADKSQSNPSISTDKKPASRKWRILTASELIRPKSR